VAARAGYGRPVARQLRAQIPGGVYHVYSHGLRALPLFEDDEDRATFLRLLAQVVGLCGWLCHSYCVMTTHYHLLVETPEPNIAVGMHRLNGFYAAEFNRRHATRGHVLERRYQTILVESDAHFMTTVAYIAANPVRAGICRRPEDYRWSGYASLIGKAPRAAFLERSLLERFHADRRRAMELLRRFVEAYIAGGHEA
jgi:REP-associated tyrosine transposase